MSNRMKLREPLPQAKIKGRASRSSSQHNSPTTPNQDIAMATVSSSSLSSVESSIIASKKVSPDSAVQELATSVESETCKPDGGVEGKTEGADS